MCLWSGFFFLLNRQLGAADAGGWREKRGKAEAAGKRVKYISVVFLCCFFFIWRDTRGDDRNQIQINLLLSRSVLLDDVGCVLGEEGINQARRDEKRNWWESWGKSRGGGRRIVFVEGRWV